MRNLKWIIIFLGLALGIYFLVPYAMPDPNSF
jgi:hypothetical protein